MTLNVKKMAMAFALVLVSCAAEAEAAKTTYIVTNNRFNYVKLKEIGGKEAQALHLSHPATLDEVGLRAALASINLSRSYVVKKEVDAQQVFDEQAINYLTPALVRAFTQASPQEIVVFSYLSKNPYFIIRNDRLNICRAWVSGDEIHIKFEKLYAKLFGDTDKRGNEARFIAQAKSLRVQLELGEGQKLGIDDPEEVVLSFGYNYVKRPEPEKPITEGVTMSGQKVPLEGGAVEATVPALEEKAPKKKGKGAKAEIAATPPPSLPPVPQKSAKDRLEELQQLRKDKLIDQKEYEEKKREILKEL
jgi:hypothetical protein